MVSVEAEPQLQVRLVIGVMATAVNQKYQDQIRACIDTWCRETTELNVPVYFFGGHLPFPVNNYINLPGAQEDYNSAFDKQFRGLQYLHGHISADFYMIIGTDTYLNIPNLLKLLDKYDPAKDLYLGGHGCHLQHQNTRLLDGYTVYYMSGGAGFVLTKGTTTKIVTQIDEIKQEWPLICDRNSKNDLLPACDVALAYYLHKLSIFPTVEKGFYPYTSHGQYEHVVVDRQMDLETLISCHYMTPTLMEEYHAYQKRQSNDSIKRGWTLITAFYQKESFMSRLLSLSYPMVIFCDPSLYPKIWQSRRPYLNQTYFVQCKFEEKWIHLEQTLQTDPFRTTHFMWIEESFSDISEFSNVMEAYRDKTTLLYVDYSKQLSGDIITGHIDSLREVCRHLKTEKRSLENIPEGSLRIYIWKSLELSGNSTEWRYYH